MLGTKPHCFEYFTKVLDLIDGALQSSLTSWRHSLLDIAAQSKFVTHVHLLFREPAAGGVSLQTFALIYKYKSSPAYCSTKALCLFHKSIFN